jgi:cell division protein FtsI (penicillin-binding protein 3)
MANLTVDPETGELVANGGNAALTSVFEPGSVNKIITLAAAIEEGVVSPTTHLDVPDHLQVSDHLFTDSHPHPTSSWTPTDIMATSSNIGTIMLGRQLGPERIDDYLHRFGFGERTAIDFPNESGGLLLPVDNWSGTSIGSIPIGQGVAVTAMQMLAAYNVIANGGVYVEPSLVLGTRGPDGAIAPVAAPGSHRVVSEQTADQVRDMLVAVVEAGTGQEAAIEGYTVAGKTGTARKPQANGTYQDASGYHYVTTFAGFVPAQDPQLSIIIVIDEPSNGYYASQVTAPVFAELARYGLRQFRIPPPTAPFVSSVPAAVAAEEPIVADTAADSDSPVRGEVATAPEPEVDDEAVEVDDEAIDESTTTTEPDGAPP